MIREIPKGLYCGEIAVPPSKSFLHRALICASLAEGETTIRNFSLCDDVAATAECLEKLGAEIKINGDGTAAVRGMKLCDIPEGITLDCRESASTLRFLMPIAFVSGKRLTFTGSRRLLERPIDVYAELCDSKQISIICDENGITAEGKLENGFFRIDGSVSSQFAGGLMMALPMLGGYSVIELVPPVVSAPYIDMTAEVMRLFGVSCEINGNRIVIPSEKRFVPADVTAEGDWSAGAVLYALNSVGSEITIRGLTDGTCQGDRAIRLLLGRMRRGNTVIDITDVPDLAPVLMAAAPFYRGVTLIGTDRLKTKESDRGKAMAEELARFGINTEIGDDFIRVPEADCLPESNIACDSHDDHRIAMACTVLLSYMGGTVSGAECVAKSWPGFFDALDGIREIPDEYEF